MASSGSKRAHEDIVMAEESPRSAKSARRVLNTRADVEIFHRALYRPIIPDFDNFGAGDVIFPTPTAAAAASRPRLFKTHGWMKGRVLEEPDQPSKSLSAEECQEMSPASSNRWTPVYCWRCGMRRGLS